MAPVKNGRLIYKEMPTEYPIPGKTTVYDDSETIDLEHAPLKGGLLIKMLVVSIDPYIRKKMRDPSKPYFSPPYIPGNSIDNFGVGVVLRSEASGFKVGDHVYGLLPFDEYVVWDKPEELIVLKNEENLPWSVYLGVAGMPGQTAYCGWKEHSSAKKGETLFVTAGAGAVGSAVIQLAKAEGLKVIASAGSEDKVAYMKSLGADVVFNYKTTRAHDVLKTEGPIDIYWDNTGGEPLEAAIEYSAVQSRIIICGTISGYNGALYPVSNFGIVFEREITIYGFLFARLFAKYKDQFFAEIPKRIASGEFKHKEDFTYGLENAGQAIYDVQVGKNQGKSVVVVAKE